MTTPALVEAKGVTKAFGDMLANDSVDLAVSEGEIHALLGENGAGKSTLVKMLYGLLQPSAGEILFRGKPVRFADPKAARRAGIGMVFQHFSLFEALTVAENVALALDEASTDIADRVAAISKSYGLPLEPSREVWRLSVGERQRIEIVRALMQNPRLLILDEPTSVLTPQEVEQLFETLGRVRAEGRSILYISHKLDEVRRLCDRATILRRGKVVATCDPRRETAASLARMMVGEDIAALRHDPHDGCGEERLVISNLSLPPADLHGASLKNVSLAVKAGEIFGIAGVAGNGQDELFAALSGERLTAKPQSIRIDGADVGRLGVTDRRRSGAAFIPEERLGHGAAPAFALSDNVLVSHHATGGFVRMGLIDRAAARGFVETITRAFDLRKATADPPAKALSGGNLQKFVVGREILRKPGVLVVAQPTWGVDAGAARIIRQALIDLAKGGAAVLVISQDLDELFEMCDRMAVLFHGRLSPAEPVSGLSRESVGLIMGGAMEAAA